MQGCLKHIPRIWKMWSVFSQNRAGDPLNYQLKVKLTLKMDSLSGSPVIFVIKASTYLTQGEALHSKHNLTSTAV